MTNDKRIHNKLSQRFILSFWYPLALSWIMMSIAGPIVNAGIARLPNAKVELAAYGVAQPIAVLLESPIIYLLSAAVALVQNRATFRLVRRFMLHLSLALTVLSALVYFTPAYDVLILSILGVPREVAAAAQPAMQVLLLWPAAIAGRRFLQGILIQHGHTRFVTFGTVCRLATLIATVGIGTWHGGLSGALMGGLALMLSVLVEAIVIAWWAWPVVRLHIWERDESDDPPEPDLTYAGLWRFYLPLAATDMMRVVSRPVVVAGIARSAMPDLSLAAWPVAYGLAMLMSSPIRAFQEVVIALLDDESSYAALRRFILTAGVSLSTLMALVVFTPLGHVYFSTVLGVPREVEPLAVDGARVMALFSLLLAWQNLYRGRLIRRYETRYIQFGMAANLISLVVMLGVGAWLGRLSGILLGAIAIVLAHVVEVGVLSTAGRPAQTVPEIQPAAEAHP